MTVQGQGPSSQARVSAIHVSLLHRASAPCSLSPFLRFSDSPLLLRISSLGSRLSALPVIPH
jgi:hypothetical protein